MGVSITRKNIWDTVGKAGLEFARDSGFQQHVHASYPDATFRLHIRFPDRVNGSHRRFLRVKEIAVSLRPLGHLSVALRLAPSALAIVVVINFDFQEFDRMLCAGRPAVTNRLCHGWC
jgi:hypothetical protein